jgi:hypothetical protein
VQPLPSSQLGAAPPTHVPPEQASPVVHALPSSQGSVLFAYTQPEAGSQLSSVQPLLSSQLGAAPPTHVPPEQASPAVHALPSLQGSVLFVCVQPLAGSQASSVQGLPSLQSGAEPPTQLPPEHASPVVHASPSSQGSVLFAYTQPEAGSQLSSVQPLLSLQLIGVPPQLPSKHTSPAVHALPSLHDAVLFGCVQPPPSHTSFVQPLPSSAHGPLLFVCTQPEAGSQESSVHALPSSQLGAEPPTQLPPAQVSF